MALARPLRAEVEAGGDPIRFILKSDLTTNPGT
jgi:hypothetical protein